MRGTADGQAHDNAASLRDQGTWAESRPDELFLDLQAVFTRCYDTGPYRRRVVDDPARLVPGLNPDKTHWGPAGASAAGQRVLKTLYRLAFACEGSRFKTSKRQDRHCSYFMIILIALNPSTPLQLNVVLRQNSLTFFNFSTRMRGAPWRGQFLKVLWLRLLRV